MARFFKKGFIYLFLKRGEQRKGGRETLMCKRNINLLSLHPTGGTWPATQAHALTGTEPNWRPFASQEDNQLSHMDQGCRLDS